MNIKETNTFLILIITSNIIAYALNIVINILWDKALKIKNTVTKKEISSSLITLLLNILISIPGFILWTKNIIIFSDLNSILTFIIIFLIMDFLMYFLHWSSHNLSFIKKVHLKHHEHSEKFNYTSLYYLSSWETVLFGILLTLIPIILPININGFIAFLVFNWLYGVIAHLNTKSNNPYFFIFTNNIYHKTHHQSSNKNYGFYTFFWDKIFRTEKNK